MDDESYDGIMKEVFAIETGVEDTKKQVVTFGVQGFLRATNTNKWEIKVKVTKNIQTQFQSLLFILEEKVQRPNINYIDLRYGDQIYVQ